jgi:hypothetical protein
MSKFYNSLKDFIKDEISRIERLEDLAKMIEMAI